MAKKGHAYLDRATPRPMCNQIYAVSWSFLAGSYAKGTARPESDIDVAVIAPRLEGDWLDTSSALWLATMRVDTTIEPVLIDAQHDSSPLYEDVMRTGIAI